MKSGLLTFILLISTLSFAQTYKVIHSFAGPPNDASYVVSGLVFDSQGNLYGASANGGTYSMGAVFELSPQPGGGWSKTLLYSFCTISNGQLCLDGQSSDASLVMDSTGNLYGTTIAGGSRDNCPNIGSGCGTVFELSPPSKPGDEWIQKVLYNFCSDFSGEQCLDGQGPVGRLVFDNSGNLYGTTTGGGSGNIGTVGAGVVFELSPSVDGWKENVLYNFCVGGKNNICPDGNGPFAGVTFDSRGNLYGTTIDGGSKNGAGSGTVYELVSEKGSWKQAILLSLGSSTSAYGLDGTVSFDPQGNLYSTVDLPTGGVFSLNPKTRKVRSFAFDGSNGAGPLSGVVIDPKLGVLYGTTSGAGISGGNVYAIKSNGKELVLHNFCSQQNCTDGEIPWAMLIQDKAGNLYGTTEFGGEYGAGVVFEITP